ncbi:MAG: hypothetical protein ABI639_06645 [Thermoanaerobaculia bacterium]
MDRDLGPGVGQIFKESGLNVRLHQEVFSEKSAQDSVADEIWLRHCGNNGWVAVSRDNDITRTPASVAAVMESGARLFILRGQLPHPELAAQFLGAIDKIHRTLARETGGFIARVKRETFPRSRGKFVVDISIFMNQKKWASNVGGEHSAPDKA